MKKPTVFISYSHADSQFVNGLADKLKGSGVDVWIDKWKIKVGDSITHKIHEGIGASDCLIVVLSCASANSKWVREELSAATIRNVEQDKHAFILPALIEDCEIPAILQHRKYANFKDHPKEALQELLEVIQAANPDKVFPPPPSISGPLLKDRLLTIARNPMWQMVSAIIALIALGWMIYTFYVGGDSPNPLMSPLAPVWQTMRGVFGQLDSRLAFTSNRDGNPELYAMDKEVKITRLTRNVASDDSPSWSSDRTQIAFASNRDGQAEIYWMKDDGTEVTRVTNHPASDIEPAWSPAGGYIAFTSDREGKREIYVISLDGIARITRTPGNAESWEPAWGPNGIILFTSDRDGKREVYRTDQAGNVVRMTNTPGSGESWSPAWCGYYTVFVSNRDGKKEIYVITQGGELQRVTHTPGSRESWDPTCSAFRRFITFTSDRSGKLEVHTTSEEESRQLTSAPSDGENWSPNRQ
jgi:TolB protein